MTEVEGEWDAWTMGHSSWMLALTATAWWADEPAMVASGGAISLLLLVVFGRARWTERGDFGLANSLTLLRLAAVVAVATMRTAGPAAALVVIGILLLDGIDGWVARKLGAASAFGAKFDMETDALLVAVVGAMLAAERRLEAWVLIPGSLRYVYAVVIRVARARGEAPRSLFGRYVFALLVTSFASSLWPVGSAHRFFSAAASALTVYSFGRSVYWSFVGARAKVSVPSSP